MKKLVLLVNYGGPEADKHSAVGYLKNLFSDGVVFPLPKPVRWFLSRIIAQRRWKESVEIINAIGGKSPLLPQSRKQAEELQKLLGSNYSVKVAMRYSEPTIKDVLNEMHRGEVILLPAFPHYSIATWKTVIEETEKYLPEGRLKTVRPFYDCEGFITGWVEEIKKHLDGLKKPFLLFSAHSLPLYLIKRGDPYPEQVKESARSIAQRLNLPFAVSYQSKLGPLKWLEPSTEEALKKLSSEGVKEVVVIPISFTTENSETLYEIDGYYNNLSRKVGIERFVRPPVPYDSPDWIDCFRKLIEEID